MRKQLTVVAILAIMVGFTACQKDGVFNPKEKIAKIYTSSESVVTYAGLPTQTFSTPKTLGQIWTWDKNLLTKIESMDEELGKGSNYTTFQYDGKQLSKILEGDEISTFTYNKSKLDKVEVTRGSELVMSIKYEHDGKKISKMTVSKSLENDDEYWDVKIAKSPAFQFLMPQSTREKLSQNFKSGAKATAKFQMVVAFEWDGDNIVKETYTYPSKPSDKEVMTYTYDKNLNPMYHFLGGEFGAITGSKNNILTETSTSETSTSDNFTNTTKYEYVYNGKFPAEMKHSYEYSDYGISAKMTTTIYYEYR